MADDQTKVNEGLFLTIIKLQKLSNEEGYDKQDCQKRYLYFLSLFIELSSVASMYYCQVHLSNVERSVLFQLSRDEK